MSKLPNGWNATALKTIAFISSGVGFPKKYQGLKSELYPLYKVKDVSVAYLTNNAFLDKSDHTVSDEIMKKIKGKVFPIGTTMFAKIGEALKLNRRVFVTKKGLADNNVMGVKAFIGEMDRYLFYFLQFNDIASLSKSTTVPSVRKSSIEDICVSLPPLNEQIRIANTLDSLLGKLEATQKRLDKIPILLKRFRQSVLAAAVSGELTKDWRNNSLFGNETNIGKISEPVRYGTSKKCSPDPDLDGTPVLRIPNIKSGTISFKDLKYANFNEKELKSLSLKKGDILIIRSNGSLDLVGKVALVEELKTTTLFAGYLIRIRIKEIKEHLPKYILYALQSPQIRSVIELTARSTSGVNNINSKELQSLSFLLPRIKEQKQIVQQVESLFNLADRVEKQYQAAKQRTDKLTQSILAKAFRGKLVPQDPNDEPAGELLARIQAKKDK